MLLKCIAIDVEASALQLIKDYANELPTLQLVGVFNDAAAAVEFIKEEPVHLLFFDIQISDISNLEFIGSLQNKPMIIFTTMHKKFAVEGLEHDAVDYLQKPFTFESFAKAVAKAEEYYKYKTSLSTGEEHLYVYSDYKLTKINLEKIEFMESLEDYTRIHITDDKPVLTLMPLRKIIQKLPPQKFQRIHRSYVVAVNKIRSFTNKKVVLDKAEVPVSDSYVEVIRKLRKA